MRTRSQLIAMREGEAEEDSRVALASTKPVIRASLVEASLSIQQFTVERMFSDIYGVSAKKLQVDAVASLLNGSNTFLLAGTGYGKSRIAEMFYFLFKKSKKAIVLVLNPLDALGDNQVSFILVDYADELT